MPAKKTKTKGKAARTANRPTQKSVPVNGRKPGKPKTTKPKTKNQKWLEGVALEAKQALLTARQAGRQNDQLCERIETIERKQGDHLRLIDGLVTRVKNLESHRESVNIAAEAINKEFERCAAEHNKVVSKLQSHSDAFKLHDGRIDTLRERLGKIDDLTKREELTRTNFATLKALADLNGVLIERDTEVSNTIAALRREMELIKATDSGEGQL